MFSIYGHDPRPRRGRRSPWMSSPCSPSLRRSTRSRSSALRQEAHADTTPEDPSLASPGFHWSRPVIRWPIPTLRSSMMTLLSPGCSDSSWSGSATRSGRSRAAWSARGRCQHLPAERRWAQGAFVSGTEAELRLVSGDAAFAVRPVLEALLGDGSAATNAAAPVLRSDAEQIPGWPDRRAFGVVATTGLDQAQTAAAWLVIDGSVWRTLAIDSAPHLAPAPPGWLDEALARHRSRDGRRRVVTAQGMIGANVGQLRGLANEFAAAADRIEAEAQGDCHDGSEQSLGGRGR